MSVVVLNLFILTWNVAQQKPTVDMKTLLHLPQPPGKSLPDLYIIGLQEMKCFSKDWKPFFTNTLSQYGYKRLKSKRLQAVLGIMIQVYVLEKHLEYIENIESSTTATGADMIVHKCGNKGAATIRLDLYNISTCFITSHLAPHDSGFTRRMEQLSYIEASQTFTKTEARSIFKNNLVFWFGDLNFRLHQDLNLDTDSIIESIQKNELDKLLEQDEITRLMKKGDFFMKLKEPHITFPPTFKFILGTNMYSKKRRPAWTDRILYVDSTIFTITPVMYKSVESYVISDHKPVIAVYEIRIQV